MNAKDKQREDGAVGDGRVDLEALWAKANDYCGLTGRWIVTRLITYCRELRHSVDMLEAQLALSSDEPGETVAMVRCTAFGCVRGIIDHGCGFDHNCPVCQGKGEVPVDADK